MKCPVLLFLSVLLMYPVFACAGYGKLQWNAPGKTVKKHYPKLSRLKNICYFEGVNCFGHDSLAFFEQVRPEKGLKHRLFVFQKKKLVAVEMRYDNEAVNDSLFRDKIVADLAKQLGPQKMAYKEEQDRTKINKYYIWSLKNDVVVAVYGHFKKVSPENLDWIRVKYYDRNFYDHRGADSLQASNPDSTRIYF
jgi:hypothetical protein